MAVRILAHVQDGGGLIPVYGNSGVVYIEQITTWQITDYDPGSAGIHLYRLASVSARRRLGKQIVTKAWKEASP